MGYDSRAELCGPFCGIISFPVASGVLKRAGGCKGRGMIYFAEKDPGGGVTVWQSKNIGPPGGRISGGWHGTGTGTTGLPVTSADSRSTTASSLRRAQRRGNLIIFSR